jgi:DNA polymerase III, gamma/tau subunits
MAALEGKENTAALSRIRAAAERGALAHALLVTGPGDRIGAARFAAAAMECTAETGKPCGVCTACRKVFEDIHPDVISVQDSEHKNIAVDVVRSVRSDAYIRPNEGARKAYIFEDCALLTEQDQNVLLKIVEEGPPYAAFLFCAANPAAVLQTLRSRCVELKLCPVAEDGGETEQTAAAEALCRAVGEKKRGSVTELLVELERKKTDRETLQTLLEQAHGLFSEALLTVVWAGNEGKYGKNGAVPCKKLDKTANYAHNRIIADILPGMRV